MTWGPSKQDGDIKDEWPTLPQTPFGVEQIKARRDRMRNHAGDCPTRDGNVCRCGVADRRAEQRQEV